MARNRNMLLCTLGYKPRLPLCETEGEANPKARRTYLHGVPVAFTKSDRSMVVWDDKRGGWRLLVDASWYPSLYPSKDAALAAGRAAEKRVDAIARATAPALAWMRSPDVQYAAQRRDREHAADALAHRIAERDF